MEQLQIVQIDTFTDLITPMFQFKEKNLAGREIVVPYVTADSEKYLHGYTRYF